jgi:uncharacterized protein (TIGR02271 family)
MAKTVVGLFDSFAEAQNVVQDLIDNGFRREDVSVVSNDEAHRSGERAVGTDSKADEGAGTGAVVGTVGGGALGLLIGAGLLAIPGIGPVLAAGPLAAGIGTAAATLGAGALGAGIGAATGGLVGGLVGAGVPDEDAQFYAEGVRRGGTLVSVSADDSMANSAYDIMMRHNAVDIDDRSTQWRGSGWSGSFDSTSSADIATDTTLHSTAATSAINTTSTTSTRVDNTIADAERVIPVVEEEIDISKRQVEKGGVRVETRVEERPVEEQVHLREERVNVERRPVDRPVTDADATAFREQSFELRETAEEPVVRKRARVVEEVIIDRDVTERTETIRDTVRRTDVDVQQTGGTVNTGMTSGSTVSGSSMSGSTMGSAFDTFDTDYRTHYDRTFASAGYTYDDYKPVYQYGHSLASDSRYSGRNWADFESDARTRWEEHNPGTWEQFKDSIHYAWDKARGKR